MAVFKTLGQAIDIAGKTTEYAGRGGEYMGKGIKVMGKAAQFAGEGAKLAGDAAHVVGNVVGTGVGLVGTGVKKTGQVARKATDKAPALGEKIDKNIQTMFESMKSSSDDVKEISENSLSGLITALNAITMAAANADGDVSEKELDEIEYFLKGRISITYNIAITADHEATIKKFKTKPPTLKKALVYVNKLEAVDWSMFDALIVAVIDSDNEICEKEQLFLDEFRREIIA